MAYSHHYKTTVRSLALATRRGLGFPLHRLLLTLGVLVLMASPADAARHRYHHRVTPQVQPCTIPIFCGGWQKPVRVASRRSRVRAVEQRPVRVVSRPARPLRVVEHRTRVRTVEYHPQRAARIAKAPAVRPLQVEPAYTLGAPSRFIPGRLICAVNVGVALAERGIKGTGSALALSYLRWGRSAGGPVPGAVIVSGRRGGGHVAIVSRVVNGVVYAWNATGGQRGWREIVYRHHVLDYRVAS